MSARPSPSTRSLAAWAPLMLVIGAAFAVWWVFRPAIMSSDSTWQYAQARTGSYGNTHPPLMAILLSVFFRAGLDIEHLMLLQATLGLIGLWALANVVLGMRGGACLGTAGRRKLAAVISTGLLVPLSPLMFYLMSFWKDAWLALTLPWIAAGSLHLAQSSQRGFAQLLVWLSVVLLMLVSVCTRHNAAVLIPAFVGAAILTAGVRRRSLLLGIAAVLAGVLLSAPRAMERAFAVRDERPECQIMGMELVGLCRLDPGLRKSLPHTDSHLIDDLYRRHYDFGRIDSVIWDTPHVVTDGFWTDPHRLKQEYWSAVRRFPGQILQVKLLGWVPMLGWSGTEYWFHADIDPNTLGLHPNRYAAGVRERLVRTARRVESSRWRWCSGVHLLWLIAAGCMLLVELRHALRALDRRAAVYCLAAAIPVAYYASFLLATGGYDFRFMYPASLFAQVWTAAAVLRVAVAKVRTSASVSSPSAAAVQIP